jgi:hypothetical protein
VLFAAAKRLPVLQIFAAQRLRPWPHVAGLTTFAIEHRFYSPHRFQSGGAAKRPSVRGGGARRRFYPAAYGAHAAKIP